LTVWGICKFFWRMVRNITIFLLLWWLPFAGSSQSTVKGTVKNNSTGESLPGVNVFIPEIQKGTFTGADGQYVISGLPKGQVTIQFSFIGFKTVVRQVKTGNTSVILNVSLTPEVIHTHEVVISGGDYSTQHNSAFKIESAGINKLDKSGDISLMKKLTLIPGVNVISKGVGVTTPVIRGLSTSNILVLNNGIRMEDYQFSENHPYLIDEFGVERVEVIKGAASLLYGSDAIGGVINFIREKPAPVGKIVGDVRTAYYTNTNGFDASFGVKGTHRSFFWGVRASAKSHEDYTDGTRRFVPNSRFNRQSAKIFTGFNAPVGTFRLFYDFNKMRPGMTVMPSIERVKTKGRKNEVWYQDLTNHFVTSKNSFFFERWRLDANMSYQYNDRKLMTNPESPDFTDVHMILQTVNWDIRGTRHINKNHDLIWSFNGMNQHNRNGQAPSHVLPDYRLTDLSGVVLYKGNLGRKFFIQAGVRYDYRHIDVPAQEQHENALNRDYGNISASAGGTYKISDELLLRANFAPAYRTPNIAELTQDGQHGSRYEQGDPNLKSQRNYETDISLHYHRNILMLDFSAFYNGIRNYIYLAPTADTTEEGLQIFRYTQSDARLYGFEGTGEVLPLNWLRLRAGYAFLRAEKKNGENLPLIPQNKLSGKVIFEKETKHWYKKLSFRVNADYAFAQNRPSPFETETPAYWLLNAGAGFQLMWGRQQLNLTFTLNNILDEVYLDHLSTLKGTGYYNIGRNFMVELKIPFGKNE